MKVFCLGVGIVFLCNAVIIYSNFKLVNWGSINNGHGIDIYKIITIIYSFVNLIFSVIFISLAFIKRLIKNFQNKEENPEYTNEEDIIKDIYEKGKPIRRELVFDIHGDITNKNFDKLSVNIRQEILKRFNSIKVNTITTYTVDKESQQDK